MKITYISLYCLSAIIFLIALMGNSLSKPLYSSLSERTIEVSGFKKSYLVSIDDKIDDLIYKSRQIEMQIEKIKKFFSADKVDENNYKREKNELVEKTFYDPLIMMFNYVYRIGSVFFSLVLLCFAIVFHLAYRSFDLRKRVRHLEQIVLHGHHA